MVLFLPLPPFNRRTVVTCNRCTPKGVFRKLEVIKFYFSALSSEIIKLVPFFRSMAYFHLTGL